MPILIRDEENINKVIEKGIEKLKQKGYIEKNDTIILAGGADILDQECQVNKTIGGIVKF